MSRRDGFSLVEILVALTLFIIGGLAVVRTLAVVTRMNGETWRLAQAVSAAESGLERLRAACVASRDGARLEVWPVVVERAGAPPQADTIASVLPCL